MDLICHICLYNREYSKSHETRLEPVLVATTFYQGTALCADHWSAMVEKSFIKASQDGQRTDETKELDLLHLGN